MTLADNAARMIAEKGARLTLTRTAEGPSDPPWQPGAPTTTAIEFDGFVRNVAAELIDGTNIVASDLMVVASPRATRVSDGASIDLAPQMTDTIDIGGSTKTIKRILPAPGAGSAAIYRIIVGS